MPKTKTYAHTYYISPFGYVEYSVNGEKPVPLPAGFHLGWVPPLGTVAGVLNHHTGNPALAKELAEPFNEFLQEGHRSARNASREIVLTQDDIGAFISDMQVPEDPKRGRFYLFDRTKSNDRIVVYVEENGERKWLRPDNRSIEEVVWRDLSTRGLISNPDDEFAFSLFKKWLTYAVRMHDRISFTKMAEKTAGRGVNISLNGSEPAAETAD